MAFKVLNTLLETFKITPEPVVVKAKEKRAPRVRRARKVKPKEDINK